MKKYFSRCMRTKAEQCPCYPQFSNKKAMTEAKAYNGSFTKVSYSILNCIRSAIERNFPKKET